MGFKARLKHALKQTWELASRQLAVVLKESLQLA